MHATGEAQAARTRQTAAAIAAAENSCGQVAAAERRQEGQSLAQGRGDDPSTPPIRERNTKWTRSGSSLNSTPRRAISGPDFSFATEAALARSTSGATNNMYCFFFRLFIPPVDLPIAWRFPPETSFWACLAISRLPFHIAPWGVSGRKVGRSAALPHSPNLQVINSGLMR